MIEQRRVTGIALAGELDEERGANRLGESAPFRHDLAPALVRVRQS